MKLIIQIPCYNEEKTLLSVLEGIPKQIDGIDEIETIIIDDGSNDKTIQIANKFGVNYIVKHIGNKGLGNSFSSGVHKALLEGVDILVNTDGDNQYPGFYIPKLIKPILEQEADIVMGNRQTSKIKHFSFIKKIFQWLGSALVRLLSGTTIPDSVSGFRAYSRESLLKINVTSDFSYAVDTLIQAGKKRIKIVSIDIEINTPTRHSRLFKNILDHIFKTSQIMLRVYAMYNPIRIFFLSATPFFILGIIGLTRFIYYYIQNPISTGKIQSLVISGVFLMIAIQFFAMGIIGDLIAKNRRLIEDDLYLTKKQYFNSKK